MKDHRYCLYIIRLFYSHGHLYFFYSNLHFVILCQPFQPALLYIVPAAIGFLAAHVIWNGEVKPVCFYIFPWTYFWSILKEQIFYFRQVLTFSNTLSFFFLSIWYTLCCNFYTNHVFLFFWH